MKPLVEAVFVFMVFLHCPPPLPRPPKTTAACTLARSDLPDVTSNKQYIYFALIRKPALAIVLANLSLLPRLNSTEVFSRFAPLRKHSLWLLIVAAAQFPTSMALQLSLPRDLATIIKCRNFSRDSSLLAALLEAKDFCDIGNLNCRNGKLATNWCSDQPLAALLKKRDQMVECRLKQEYVTYTVSGVNALADVPLIIALLCHICIEDDMKGA